MTLYMNKDLFTKADDETIDIINKAVEDLRKLGATIVDPGPDGAFFQSCVNKIVPAWHNQQFIKNFLDLFPFDNSGNPSTDHISTLVDMYLDPSLVPHTETGRPSIRNLGGKNNDTGEGRYNLEVYIQERNDEKIQDLADL